MASFPQRGRPRDPEVDRSILFAALELLGELGYDRLTIEGVAARSGTGKASIYRRWTGKPELILDAVRLLEESFTSTPPDTGNLRDDLIAVIPQFTVFSTFGPSQAPIILGMAQAMQSDEKIADYMRARFTSDVRHASEIVLERAIARGEISAEARGIRLFHDLAPSLTIGRLLLTLDPIDEQFQTELVDTILIPLLHASAPKETT
ncbi:TetR/AcrR family transcriptional regulator [Microbacterium sp. A196]|uniref:TetR/AcrR family transcriptional regulator n=1 Tax=unclassified Microbacterium TaxID=2609290 RepID=UPI003FD25097